MKNKRAHYIAVRDGLRKEDINQKSTQITQSILADNRVAKAQVVFVYVSFKSEVNTHHLIAELLDIGKRVVVPKVNREKKEMYSIEVKDFDELGPSSTYGTLEPSSFENAVLPHEIDVALVPGLAFDVSGYRIGYGGGYYDKFLPKMNLEAPKIGLCFDVQLVENTLPEQWDFPMDTVITEQRVIDVINRK